MMGLLLFSLVYEPISYVLEVLQLKLIRSNEFQADSFAHEKGMGDLL